MLPVHGTAVQLNQYRTSSFCTSNGCVAVSVSASEVAVRDTKDPSLPPHRFTHDEWRDFLQGVRNGEFDLPARSDRH